MIVSIAGKPGSGKSMIAKRLASTLGVPCFSTGAHFRQLAADRGLSLEALTRLSETDPRIDRAIDDFQRQLPSRERDFVIEGRLAFRFIPQSRKIFLDVSLDAAAQRVFAAVQQGERQPEGQRFDSLAAVRSTLEWRAASERKRYATLYGIADLYDPRLYDVVIDTTHLNRDEAFERVLAFVQSSPQPLPTP